VIEPVQFRAWDMSFGRDGRGAPLVQRMFYYRATIKSRTTASGQNIDDILAAVDRWRPAKRTVGDPNRTDAFTVVYADMQIGKWEAVGGTERTIDRVLAVTEQAVAEYRALAKRGEVGPVALIFPGDGCEGFVSQGGRLIWRTDLAPTEMARVYRRLLTHAVLAFAKVAPAVSVITVGGNHDEASRQVATHHADSWDIEAASAVRDALELSPEKFGHVSWHFPSVDHDVVTVDLNGTIVAVAHGHQMKGGAETWWAKQAHGMRPAGDATLLISGHYHHLRVTQTGAKTWVQCPSLDNGSEWWARETGASAPAGLLTLTVGRGGWDRVRVLTWEGDQP
jgi:predicted phosphodiesterase